MALITVGIPIWNGEAYIDRCLNCVTNQTISDLEILIVVGIGADKTLEKTLEWQRHDCRINIVIRWEHALGNGRNLITDMAQGKYIFYLDVDDLIDTDCLEKMVKPLEEDDEIQMSHCGFDFIFKDGHHEKGWGEAAIEGKLFLDFRSYLKLVRPGLLVSSLYRTDVMRTNSLREYSGYSQDSAFRYQLADVINCCYLIKSPLYHYYQDNENSIMHKNKKEYSYFDAMRFAFSFLKMRGHFEEHRDALMECCYYIVECLIPNSGYDADVIKTADEFEYEYWPELISMKKIIGANVDLTKSNDMSYRIARMSVLSLRFHEVEINKKSLILFCKNNKYERIIVYGMGNYGSRLYSIFKEVDGLNVLAVDQNATKMTVDDFKIYSIEEAREFKFGARDLMVDCVMRDEDLIINKLKSLFECKIIHLQELLLGLNI